MTLEKMLTPADVGHLLNRDPATVRRMIGRGELEASRVGGKLLIRPSSVEAMLEAAKVEPVPVASPAAPSNVTHLPPGGSFRERRKRSA
jgi:excisionase family DNA binding protein